MKSKDVPQDNSRTYGGHKKLFYAVGEDGDYEGVQSSGWEVESFATVAAVEQLERETAAALADARAGKVSPLAYHMLAKRMDIATLASASGISTWRIRRHLKPKIFASLSDEKKRRYADTLDMPLEALLRLPDAPSKSDAT
ncbi:hypothetical protein [Henriciella litoralis]|uniref:hypothetical protein n=1 Tax=Henriciella litoralis TaxID=568102 RepID=UPI000A05A210|nr:hypothetical protein [Henriciella litoralis]